ncbi:Capsanthin/capsorubin synthase, chromoplast [Glycine soja]|uniref:Capsanthin/capsorubin synthase, chromoplast n=1 Tax=Glycine soja TaxID=3848 RepID=A0A0B2R1Q2_GLYSO|nr:Capsanthin/capsorubin synthase, chromoplast [Glycine soja]
MARGVGKGIGLGVSLPESYLSTCICQLPNSIIDNTTNHLPRFCTISLYFSPSLKSENHRKKWGTISCYFPAPPLLIKPHQPLTPPFPLPQTHHTVSRKLIRGGKRVHSTSNSDRAHFDVIIIGADPAGTRLAEQVSLYGVKGSLVVDVSGFGSSFVAYDKVKNHGFQIAHSVLAEVDDHPFDLDKMVLVDWRDSHLGNEPYLRASSSRFPTFLYAMPFSSNLIFLEETSLDEKCLIPMGGPLPRTPQEVMAIGSTSGVVHPSTGYMVARTMAVAPVVAFAIAECLGSTRMIRGKQLSGKVLNSMWPIENRLVREFYSYGMETLLKVDLNGNRSFFDAFFDLKPYYWQGFLSSRLTLNELVWLSISLFGHASNPSRFDILTKCHVPLAKMMGNIALEYIG